MPLELAFIPFAGQSSDAGLRSKRFLMHPFPARSALKALLSP